jgi:hypothetical protein
LKINEWIVPLPLHKGVIKKTIRIYIENKTQHNKLPTEDNPPPPQKNLG